jgi:hypothetical protein
MALLEVFTLSGVSLPLSLHPVKASALDVKQQQTRMTA